MVTVGDSPVVRRWRGLLMFMALDVILLLFQIMQRSLSPYSVTNWAKLFTTSHLLAIGRDFRVTSELPTVILVDIVVAILPPWALCQAYPT